MQSSEQTYEGPWRVTSYDSDPPGTFTGMGAEKRYTFNVSGFGPSNMVDPSPGSFTKEELHYPSGTWTHKNTAYNFNVVYSGYWCTSNGLYLFHANPAISALLDPYTACLQDMYDKIRGPAGGLDEVIGELGETKKLYDSLRNPISGFGRATKSFANAVTRAKGTRNAAKQIADAQLTYAFGAAPLVDSINNTVTQLQPKLEERRTVKAFKTMRTVDTESRASGNGFTANARTACSSRCQLSVTFFVIDPDLLTASVLGLTNPLSTAWALSRGSFLIDWAFNVGQYLDQVENSLGLGLQFVRGYRTNTVRYDTTVVYTRNDVDSGYCKGSYTSKSKNRTILHTFPFPRIPQFNPPFKGGGKRLLNASALLAGLL